MKKVAQPIKLLSNVMFKCVLTCHLSHRWNCRTFFFGRLWQVNLIISVKWLKYLIFYSYFRCTSFSTNNFLTLHYKSFAQQQRYTIYHHIHSHVEFITWSFRKISTQIPAIFPSFHQKDCEIEVDHMIICSDHKIQCVAQCSENVNSCLRSDLQISVGAGNCRCCNPRISCCQRRITQITAVIIDLLCQHVALIVLASRATHWHCALLRQGAVSERVGARVAGAHGVQPEARGELQLQGRRLQRRGAGGELRPPEDHHQTRP